LAVLCCVRDGRAETLCCSRGLGPPGLWYPQHSHCVWSIVDFARSIQYDPSRKIHTNIGRSNGTIRRQDSVPPGPFSRDMPPRDSPQVWHGQKRTPRQVEANRPGTEEDTQSTTDPPPNYNPTLVWILVQLSACIFLFLVWAPDPSRTTAIIAAGTEYVGAFRQCSGSSCEDWLQGGKPAVGGL
jgi:hypothetical protein